MLEYLSLEQYTLLFLIHISDMDVKSGYIIKNYAVENIEKLQNNSIRILNFKGPPAEASNLE